MPRRFSDEWVRKMSELEFDLETGVGRPVGSHLIYTEAKPAESPAAAESSGGRIFHVALSTLVKNWRRQNRWSAETAAEKIGIALEELVEIETETTELPEPRVVYFLAEAMEVPHSRLQQLAGLVQEVEPTVVQSALRFAAHARPEAELSTSEREHLRAFLSALRDDVD